MWKLGEEKKSPLLEKRPSPPSAPVMASYTDGLCSVKRPLSTCSTPSASCTKIYKFGPIHTLTGLGYFWVIVSKNVEFSVFKWILSEQKQPQKKQHNENIKLQLKILYDPLTNLPRSTLIECSRRLEYIREVRAFSMIICINYVVSIANITIKRIKLQTKCIQQTYLTVFTINFVHRSPFTVYKETKDQLLCTRKSSPFAHSKTDIRCDVLPD